MKPALGYPSQYSIKGCRIVAKNKYLFLYKYGSTNYAHDGKNNYYFSNLDSSYYSDFDVIASDVLYDTITDTFSAYMASHVNGATKLYLGKLTGGVGDHYGFIVEERGSVDNPISIKALQGYKAHYVYDRDDEDYRIYNFNSKTDIFIEIKYDYNDVDNGYLMNLSSRFSDDGTKLFLPSGIYFIDIEKYVKYLNVGTGKYVTNHSTGNDTCYSFSGKSTIYSNVITEPLKLKVSSDVSINTDFIKFIAEGLWTELDEFYVANKQELYITESRTDNSGKALWYFPEINKLSLPSEMTALHPISKTEVALFTSDEVWYTDYQEGAYLFYKSKLKLGLGKGNDVITSYDGTNVIFATERGLASLSYQNFVASTDQILTYLSDPISEQFKEFVTKPVKLLRYRYWILAYSPALTKGYLFDLRNNSWWPMTYHSSPTEFFVVNDEVLLLSNSKLFKLDKSDNDYYDSDSGSYRIDWNFKSQKLHLNVINYYKHISNLTLYSVLDSDKQVNFVMDVNNYRKTVNTTEIQTISYKVDTIRTYVKRVNFPKVNEFQYNIHQDDEQAIRLPLSLSGITVKYKVSGQVR